MKMSLSQILKLNNKNNRENEVKTIFEVEIFVNAKNTNV